MGNLFRIDPEWVETPWQKKVWLAARVVGVALFTALLAMRADQWIGGINGHIVAVSICLAAVGLISSMEA